jgi:putative CocE/NonD family hydrolase
MNKRLWLIVWMGLNLVFSHHYLLAQTPVDERAESIRANYTKTEVKIRMRDGVELFTSIYEPNDTDPTQHYPILLTRTPYSVGPYGLSQYKTRLGPTAEFEKNKYIFVFQDVRGRYMSGGSFSDMRPHIANKTSPQQIDESSDTYDTIDWLVSNLDRNNSRVGQWGISYPGFYTSAGAIDSHPALKAVSPQAPIADWFFDDFHRNGAFVLPMGFNFFYSFGRSRPDPTTDNYPGFQFPSRDGYQFFLELGPLSNVDSKYFQEEIHFWNELESHPNYDRFWQERNILPHLKNIQASVLTVGGWYDTEDLYGPLKTYAAIEQQNPNIKNHLVMGPWYHGQWSGDEGRKLGQADFGFATSSWYQQHVLLPFFESNLRPQPTATRATTTAGAANTAGAASPVQLAEATVFETGANRWRQFEHWPPQQVVPQTWYVADQGKLTTQPPTVAQASDDFVSDPSKPVPYTMEITTAWAKDYVTEDQRFASWRPDVLVYRSEVFHEPLTLAGPIQAQLWVSTTQGDADWIVKIIDVEPVQKDGTARGRPTTAPQALPSGRHELIRAGVIRGRFRDSFEHPKPFQPNQPTLVQLELSDILHTFQRGHRLMIHIQSSWFPFIDRNPQKYVPNIFEAVEDDFVRAQHTVYRNSQHPTLLQLPVLTH